MKLKPILNLTLAGTLLLPAATSHAQADDAPTIEVLELTVTGNEIGGAGGERLKQDLRDTQMVMIGEDHGFAGPPELAGALANELQKASGKPVYLTVEVGPNGTKWAEDLLRKDGVAGLGKALAGQPMALPFLSNVEDAVLAEPFARARRLWGADQEFLGTTAQLLDDAAKQCGDKAVSQQMGELAARDRSNILAGRFDDLAMNVLAPAKFREMGKACGKKAERVFSDIAESARIYQYYGSRQYARNNEERSALMTGYFMDRYRRAPETAPRILFKFGASHAGRGTSTTDIYDLGSYLPPLAAANGLRSLHIIWVPVEGSVRQIAPEGGRMTKVVPYKGEGIAKLLEVAGIPLSRIPEGGQVLIPMKPLRYALKRKQRAELDDLARFTLLGFDYLVTTRGAKPATHFEAWDGGR